MKIRGNVVGTPLKPERAVVAATNLTPAQQKQARENIGVCDLIVTVTNGVVSHTNSQIYEHVQNGGVAYLQYDFLMPLSVTETSATCAYVYDDGIIDYFEIYDGSFNKAEFYFATSEQYYDLKQKVEGLSNISQDHDEQLGDIDTALDSIIAIQNSLIGGDAE